MNTSVDRDLLRPTKIGLLTESSQPPSLQTIVRELRTELAPTATSTTGTARKQYRAVLKKASQGRVNPTTWYSEWRNAYTNAKLYRLSEIEGTLAIMDVAYIYNPNSWGQGFGAIVCMNDAAPRSWGHSNLDSDTKFYRVIVSDRSGPL